MAIDSQQKRMSAVSPSCPWRGPMVDPSPAGFFRPKRAAADYMYSFPETGGAFYGNAVINMTYFGRVAINPTIFGSTRITPSQ